jgi:hypothetical protein
MTDTAELRSLRNGGNGALISRVYEAASLEDYPAIITCSNLRDHGPHEWHTSFANGYVARWCPGRDGEYTP